MDDIKINIKRIKTKFIILIIIKAITTSQSSRGHLSEKKRNSKAC